VVSLYKTMPAPPFATEVRGSMGTYNKPHFAGIRVIFLAKVPHSDITDYYEQEFKTRGWQVCVINDHSPYHEPGPVFEKGNFYGELVFMRVSPNSYIFDLNWTDDPSPSCTST